MQKLATTDDVPPLTDEKPSAYVYLKLFTDASSILNTCSAPPVPRRPS